MNRRRVALPLLLSSLLLAGCAQEGSAQDPAAPPQNSLNSQHEDAAEDDGAQNEDVPFGYDGASGPDHWAELNDDWTDCADASAQSPIDLTGARETSLADPEFHYSVGDLELENNTHTVLAEEEEGSWIVLDGTRYELVQFHFHEGSEHTVDGRAYDGELHLVHTADDGRTAVVGVLFEAGAAHAALADYFASLPTADDQEAEIADFDTAALLPTDHRTYRYTGSLTTPPCTGGVDWLVMASPVRASVQQLAAFREVVTANARPTQPLGERELVLDAD